MMELYAEYRREKDKADVIHTSEGFIVFQVWGSRVHICEVYVTRHSRGKGISRELEKIVTLRAKEVGATRITCHINPSDPGYPFRANLLHRAGYTKSDDSGRTEQLWEKAV